MHNARNKGQLKCPLCGYSQMGLQPASVCPECGLPETRGRVKFLTESDRLWSTLTRVSIVGFVSACVADMLLRLVGIFAGVRSLGWIGGCAIDLAWLVLAASAMMLGQRHRLSAHAGWVRILCRASGVLMLAGLALVVLIAARIIWVLPWHIAPILELATMPRILAVVCGAATLQQLLSLIGGPTASRRTEIIVQATIVLGAIGLTLSVMYAASARHTHDDPYSTLQRALSVRHYLALIYVPLAAYVGVLAYRQLRRV